MRSARELGLRTVAVYSDADRAAPHVREADEAVRLGPAPAARELPARRRRPRGRAARPAPARSIPATGSCPRTPASRAAWRRPGSSSSARPPRSSRRSAPSTPPASSPRGAGVPMLAGHRAARRSEDEAVAAAAAIGFPVMLKATGGGGGIGMQACARPTSSATAFARVARHAEASFGSGGVFLERLVRRGPPRRGAALRRRRRPRRRARRPRLLAAAPQPEGDRGGAGARAAGRRCASGWPRRRAPLAASVGYRSAGTVEFVYDAERGRRPSSWR